jgi:DNA-binding response OmpR family regulator
MNPDGSNQTRLTNSALKKTGRAGTRMARRSPSWIRTPPSARRYLRHRREWPDLDQHKLTVDSRPVDLTRTEFNLLEVFLSNPGYILTRDDLLEKAVGYAYEGLGRALDTHICNLRRKIEPDPGNPTYILTIYGVGYRLIGEKR